MTGAVGSEEELGAGLESVERIPLPGGACLFQNGGCLLPRRPLPPPKRGWDAQARTPKWGQIATTFVHHQRVVKGILNMASNVIRSMPSSSLEDTGTCFTLSSLFEEWEESESAARHSVFAPQPLASRPVVGPPGGAWVAGWVSTRPRCIGFLKIHLPLLDKGGGPPSHNHHRQQTRHAYRASSQAHNPTTPHPNANTAHVLPRRS